MNKINLIGRLTKDVEVKYTGEQMAVSKTSIAVDDGYGEKKKTYFINLIVFGKSAENMEKFTHKGSQVGITGKLTTGSYEKDGRKIYTHDVVVENFDLLDKREVEPEPSGFEAVNEDIPF